MVFELPRRSRALCGLNDTYAKYPWLAYGTDWLAFGHLAIAIFFVPALLRPENSRAALWCGVAACLAVIPTAMIAGQIRGIPIGWRLTDCTFGVVGLLPLGYCMRLQSRILAASIGNRT